MWFLSTLIAFLDEFRRQDDGATATEYALLTTLIALVIVGVVTAIGLEVLGMFTPVAPAL